MAVSFNLFLRANTERICFNQREDAAKHHTSVNRRDLPDIEMSACVARLLRMKGQRIATEPLLRPLVTAKSKRQGRGCRRQEDHIGWMAEVRFAATKFDNTRRKQSDTCAAQLSALFRMSEDGAMLRFTLQGSGQPQRPGLGQDRAACRLLRLSTQSPAACFEKPQGICPAGPTGSPLNLALLPTQAIRAGAPSRSAAVHRCRVGETSHREPSLTLAWNSFGRRAGRAYGFLPALELASQLVMAVPLTDGG